MAGIKNMSDLDKFYAAYREYLNAMAKVRTFTNLKSTLTDANTGNDTFSGAITHRDIDLTWVEAIEKAIPYIDRAIRDERRYIRQDEEIVPIEKSKQITTESIRHLSQHTNMIGAVENEHVTPKEILNIFREENFGIYENRFLRCAIKRSLEFVDKCIEAVSGTNDDAVASLSMMRSVFVDKQAFNFSLNCDLQYHDENREVSANEDITNLTGFERVLRLKKILSDFMSSALMKALADAPEVRSPITRTNLLVKNPAFREVLVLWEFLDHYEHNGSVGYNLIIEPSTGEMSQTMQTGIYEAVSLLQFMIKLNIGDKMRETLAERYKLEQQRLEEERLALEEQRKREEEKRIAKAVADGCAELRRELDETIENNKLEIENLTRSWEEKLEETKEEDRQVLEETKAEDLRILEETKEADRLILENTRKDYEDRLAAQKAEYEAMLAKLNAEYEEMLAEQKDAYEQKLSDQQDAYENKITAIHAEHNTAIAELNERHFEEINTVSEDYEEKIRSAEEAHAEEVKEIRRRASEEKNTIIHGYEETIAGIREENDRTLEEEKLRNEQTVADLNKKHAAALASALKAATEPLETQLGKYKADHTRLTERVTALTNSLQESESSNQKLRESNKKAEKDRTVVEKYYKTQLDNRDKEINRLRNKVDSTTEKYNAKVQKLERRMERQLDKKIEDLEKSIKTKEDTDIFDAMN